MYDELVKRLRSQCRGYGKECEDCNADGNCRSQMENEAADAIEELSAYKKALGDEHNRAAKLAWERRWIPVTERLPDNNGHLVLIRHHSNTGSHFYGLDVCVDGRWVISENATHWMPLPQPPKEE